MMFAKILVCLDGSELAAQILPYAKVQAMQFGSEVHLLNVIEKSNKEREGERSHEPAMSGYLNKMAEPLRKQDIEVKCETVEGVAAGAILAYADQCEIDLIAMATQGRSGLKRAVLGSVAGFVLRESGLPVLIIRPRETGAKTTKNAQPITKILVCLDGSELAEQVIPCATGQALAFQAKLVLFQVVPEPIAYSPGIPGAASMPVQTEAMLQQAQTDLGLAREYLEGLAAPLRKKGVKVETAAMLGSVGQTILNYASRNDVDLITIATHGRSGLKRAVFGSVADYLLRESGLPNLVIRPEQSGSGK
ncbi:MAG: universal stress protein [Dehalococcoidia bacterium]